MMSGETIRIGLVGLGDIGRLHARALRDCAGVDLAVCRGRNPDRAEALALEMGASLYESYDAMLDDPKVAGVDICVPNDLHRSYVERAAAKGKHVLCEKPIALTWDDARAMVDACRKAGVRLMVAHVLRFWPEYVRLRELLRSEALGPCLAITMRRMLSLLISVRGEDGWRHRPGRMGGVVLDLQIHDLDFLRWTFGMPEQVFCAGPRDGDGGLNHAYTTLLWPSGLRALVEGSYLLQGDPMVFTAKAVCSFGSFDYGMNLQQFAMHDMSGADAGRTAHDDPATLHCYRPGEPPEVLLRQEQDVLGAAFAREVACFADLVRGLPRDDAPEPGEALDALRLALACAESAERGEVVRIGPAL
ncbi:Gfo/Idh/MocA family protein [Singulisphaera acidiphila]|uniref:Putative dehydrogenase n=1 Tax=Singulisphaera acidiphila (strain ATCC BAA-1392 / DSM 18658 / VKM B-2454 / MOB10) TaxID=886293 RepID=L0DFI5_SINAD|nr:Gfo/Idh/MocA family oxidoreductase [Singulisphaera acidiphila]AGA28022.1 putative dehydrogenase [Singulisphaera acidiphila DSM 18658]